MAAACYSITAWCCELGDEMVMKCEKRRVTSAKNVNLCRVMKGSWLCGFSHSLAIAPSFMWPGEWSAIAVGLWLRGGENVRKCRILMEWFTSEILSFVHSPIAFAFMQLEGWRIDGHLDECLFNIDKSFLFEWCICKWNAFAQWRGKC